MPQALPLTTSISQTSTRERKNRVLSAQFGDGYSQHAPDGTNASYDSWNVVYENLTLTNRNTLWTILNAVGSWDYLTWQPPNDSTSKKWKVTADGVSEIQKGGNIFTISFKLKQVF